MNLSKEKLVNLLNDLNSLTLEEIDYIVKFVKGLKGVYDSTAIQSDITILGNIAVQKAIKENREKGIPNVYSLNGTLVYEMPDGTITTECPFD